AGVGPRRRGVAGAGAVGARPGTAGGDRRRPAAGPGAHRRVMVGPPSRGLRPDGARRGRTGGVAPDRRLLVRRLRPRHGARSPRRGVRPPQRLTARCAGPPRAPHAATLASWPERRTRRRPFSSSRPSAYTGRMPRPTRAPRASAYIRDRASAESTGAARTKELLAAHGLSPRKRFGQNFLVREELAERIVDLCRLDPDDVAVEIGPGAGALTLRIARSVRQLVAVEMDRGLAALLREELSGFPRVELIEGD